MMQPGGGSNFGFLLGKHDSIIAVVRSLIFYSSTIQEFTGAFERTASGNFFRFLIVFSFCGILLSPALSRDANTLLPWIGPLDWKFYFLAIVAFVPPCPHGLGTDGKHSDHRGHLRLEETQWGRAGWPGFFHLRWTFRSNDAA
jgi:hypothetical protein